MLQNFNGITKMGVSTESIIVLGIIDPIPVRISNYENTNFITPTNPQSFWLGKIVTDISFGPPMGSSPVRRDIYLTLSGTNGRRLVKSTNNGETFTDVTGISQI